MILDEDREGWARVSDGWRHAGSGYTVRRTVTLDDDSKYTPRYEAWAIQTPAGNRMRPVFGSMVEAQQYVEVNL